MRYLSALFEIAREKGVIEEVQEAFVSISAAVRESPEFKDFLSNPRIGRAEKKKTLMGLLEGAPALIRDFVSLLVDKGREEILVFAGEEFGNLVRDSKNVLVAKVEATKVYDDAFWGELKKHLGRATGKEIELVMEQNEDLLGGVRIIMGSKMIDASLRTRLETMRRSLKGGKA